MKHGLRTRLTDSIETALRLAEGLVEVAVVDGDDHDLLREVRLSRRRHLAARARAAHLLVQLAARRLPALHRPRHAARDRSRPGRARPEPLDLAGRARAVDGDQLELLRAGDPGDRRPLRDRPRHALGRPARGAAQPVPARHRRRQAVRHLPQPHGPQAQLHARVRGHRPQPRAALPRDRLGVPEGADRGVHGAQAVPGLPRRAAQGHEPRGHRRRPQHRRGDAHVGDGGDRVRRRARADRRPSGDRRPHPQGDPRAADVPGRRRRRLPDPRPRGRAASRAARRSASGWRPRSARG